MYFPTLEEKAIASDAEHNEVGAALVSFPFFIFSDFTERCMLKAVPKS